jgi:hypothetical protein
MVVGQDRHLLQVTYEPTDWKIICIKKPMQINQWIVDTLATALIMNSSSQAKFLIQ